MANVASSDDETTSNQSDGSEPVETLVGGRDRRSTAGNRLQNLIQREEEDDDLNLLFAEAEEEDVEFQESDVAASDAELGSSSDDDDQGPNAVADDLEGEATIQKESKLQKSKKRKAQDANTTVAGLRKRQKTNAQAKSTAPRPKKKIDRISWLPNLQDGATRASSRKQTVQNKKVTHARLKDHEVRRAKVAEQMKKAGKEREQQKPKDMTQADRLAEALQTEKLNSKSLNHWEEAEKRRAEEQAAKLAALKNRKLEGPVVSWWSGMAVWLGTKLIKYGSKDTDQEMWAEPRKRGRRPKQLMEVADSVGGASSVGTPRDHTATPGPSDSAPVPQQPASAEEVQNKPLSEVSRPESTITFTAPRGPDNFLLSGIQEFAAMPNENGSLGSSKPPSMAPSVAGTPPVVNLPPNPSAPIPVLAQVPPPQISHSTRNMVVLSNFEDLPPAERGEFGVFYNPKKVGKFKAGKPHQELCPITSLPARYRDPRTGVSYANAQAYKRLQDLQRNKFKWSAMLGCYVGEMGVVARYVPDGFV